ncbi:MAG: MoxR family ATPase [Sedimentisphaerales bacterium]|nr:MoxR family ATPase [Sedimentisphaerales bacterium]MBN2844242.1 MoxR family ATPase [Sedimentisphaerales bacterium]
MSGSTSQHYNQKILPLRNNLLSVILGKEHCVDAMVIALLAGGSVLLEDIPGVGKTTLARAVSGSISAKFNRVQFTPDLLPADILGSSIYNPVSGEFKFHQGPVFCNIMLADEINRASPRTQSALLEAMNEFHATIEGISYELPRPFMVVATQNPIDFHGTYPLPEAQLDRFLVMLDMGYPEPELEVGILQSRQKSDPLDGLQPVLSSEEICLIQQQVKDVHCDETIMRYIVELASYTRNDARLRLGVSPRGTLMLFRAAQAAAYYFDRDYVIPDDVKWVANHVLAHRIVLTASARYEGVTRQEIIKEVLAKVKVPV